MLSAAAVAAAFSVAAAYTSGAVSGLPVLLAWIVVVLAGANLAGAMVIYRPLRRQLRSSSPDRAALEKRARSLPLLSGLWVFGLTAIAMAGASLYPQGSLDSRPLEIRGVLAGTLVHCLVFATYLGLFSYLLLLDYLVSLRKHLWKSGRPITPARHRFAVRLFVVLAAVAFGPVLVALSDSWGHSAPHAAAEGLDQGLRLTGQFFHQTLHMDVLGALLLAGTVAVLVARNLTRPVDILLDAMRRVDDGDLGTKAPVVSDDEFGTLTERFNLMLDGLNERERIRRTFAHFVPESVAASLLAEDGAIAPQEREATVLFADLERFTQIASALAPREIVMLLNGYFSEVAQILHEHRGVITQFQGDAVLASFNLPATDPDHAVHAVEAALEMQKQIEGKEFHGGVRLRVRVGISTGLVVGGTVGGGERLGYTVHGDTVNFAARLEALNKELGSRILISARTAELLPASLKCRDRGLTAVRGFDKPLRVFEPIAKGLVAAAA